MSYDPVCGAEVSPKQAQWLTTNDGCVHYFCSSQCRAAFIDDPDFYLEQARVESRHDGSVFEDESFPESR